MCFHHLCLLEHGWQCSVFSVSTLLRFSFVSQLFRTEQKLLSFSIMVEALKSSWQVIAILSFSKEMEMTNNGIITITCNFNCLLVRQFLSAHFMSLYPPHQASTQTAFKCIQYLKTISLLNFRKRKCYLQHLKSDQGTLQPFSEISNLPQLSCLFHFVLICS